MIYENFLSILKSYKKFNKDINKLYSIGLDLMEGEFKLTPSVNKMLETTILSHYNKEGLEWVEWFIYESHYGKKDWSKLPSYSVDKDGNIKWIDKGKNAKYGAFDENGNPICYSYKSLWEYLEKECKIIR